MIDVIRDLLKRHLGPGVAADDSARTLQLAIATLLMEVAGADYHVSDAERHTVRRIVSDVFGLSDEQAAAVSREAEQHSDDQTSLYPFTRLLNRECSLQERVEIVRLLWEVAFVDGHIDAHEEHLVRKVAELMHVPHSQFIRGKLHHTGQA